VNHCASSDTIYVTVQDIAQSDPGKIQEIISLYPNPVRDIFYIDNPSNSQLTAILSDAFGKTAGEWTLAAGKNELNISGFKAGMYILRLTDRKGYSSETKLIKL